METYYLAQIRNLPRYATVLHGNITPARTIKALQTTEWTNLGVLPLPLCGFQQEVYTMSRRVKPVFHQSTFFVRTEFFRRILRNNTNYLAKVVAKKKVETLYTFEKQKTY